MSLLMTMLSSFFRDRTNIDTFLGGPPGFTQYHPKKSSTSRSNFLAEPPESRAEGTVKLRWNRSL
jgi:hypothetical protein